MLSSTMNSFLNKHDSTPAISASSSSTTEKAYGIERIDGTKGSLLNRHCLSLDGVRGIAVLLVLCYDCLKLAPASSPLTYAARWVAARGWTGVDLFFVLSGYLITGVLLETRGHRGYWTSFFLRRSVRIFPLYYATLFAVFCFIPGVLWIVSASETMQAPFATVREDQLWYWAYAQNWLFAWKQAWPTAIPIKHFWSLAIEEQFYLVWPFLVAWLGRRQLAWLCVALGVFSVTARTCLLLQGVTPMVVFVMTLTRLDGLCMGALLAILIRNEAWRVRFAPLLLPATVMAVLGLVCLDHVWPVMASESFAAYSAGHFLLALTFALLIGAAQYASPRSLPARTLSNPVLVLFGKYSYAIYVFHKFVYLGITHLDWSGVSESVRGWLIFATTVGSSLLAARISWVLLERPCLSLKQYIPRPDDVASIPADTQLSDAALPVGRKLAELQT